MTAVQLLAKARRMGLTLRQFDTTHVHAYPIDLLDNHPGLRKRLIEAKPAILKLLRHEATHLAKQILCGEFDCAVAMAKPHAADALLPYRDEPLFRAALARLAETQTNDERQNHE